MIISLKLSYLQKQPCAVVQYLSCNTSALFILKYINKNVYQGILTAEITQNKLNYIPCISLIHYHLCLNTCLKAAVAMEVIEKLSNLLRKLIYSSLITTVLYQVRNMCSIFWNTVFQCPIPANIQALFQYDINMCMFIFVVINEPSMTS